MMRAWFNRRKNRNLDPVEAQVDKYDEELLGTLSAASDSSNSLSIAAVGSLTLDSLAAAEAMLLEDSASFSLDDSNRELTGKSLDILSSVLERARSIDLTIGTLDEPGDNDVMADSLESLLYLQSEINRFIKMRKRLSRSASDPNPEKPNDEKEYLLREEEPEATVKELISDLNSKLSTWLPGNLTTDPSVLGGQEEVIDNDHDSTSSVYLDSSIDQLAPTLCPLAHAIQSAPFANKDWYTLKEFYRWVAHTHISPSPGVLHSFYLHRERGYLHHEYILMCFYDEQGRQSWLRAERAARFKRHHIQGDSFGPIIGGATLRETITVASSPEALTTGDEVVALQIPRRANSHSDFSHNYSQTISFKDGVSFLEVNSTASNRYRLLSENCRWFARRTTLSVHERLANSQMSAVYSWRGQPMQTSYLDSQLRREWAGGKQLDDEKFTIINVCNTRRLARSCIVERKFSEGILLCQTGLEQLDTLPAHILVEEQNYFRCSLYMALGDGLTYLGSHSAALPMVQKAVSLSTLPGPRGLMISILAPELLSVVHHELGEYEKAIAVQLPLIARLREIHSTRREECDARVLGRVLANTAAEEFLLAQAQGLGSPESAMVHITESLALTRQLFVSQPEVYRYSVADALRVQATVLNSLPSQAAKIKAVSVSRQAITLLKDALASPLFRKASVEAMNPVIIPPSALTDWMFNHMRFAVDVGMFDEGISIGEEAAARLCEALNFELAGRDQINFLARWRDEIIRERTALGVTTTLTHFERSCMCSALGQLLYYLGVHMRAGGRPPSLYTLLWEACLPILRSVIEASESPSATLHESLARACYNLGLTTSSLSLLRESVSHSRVAHSLSPTTQAKFEIIIRLTELAEAATERTDPPQWVEACSAETEALTWFRALPNIENHRRDLAGVTSNLARHLYASGRLRDSLERFLEASKQWELLFWSGGEKQAFKESLAQAVQSLRVVSDALLDAGVGSSDSIVLAERQLALRGYKRALEVSRILAENSSGRERSNDSLENGIPALTKRIGELELLNNRDSKP